jgi:hypothetical protein
MTDTREATMGRKEIYTEHAMAASENVLVEHFGGGGRIACIWILEMCVMRMGSSRMQYEM